MPRSGGGNIHKTRSNRPLKITIVGDGNVGKTSLLISYTKNVFPEDYIPTIFDQHQKTCTVDDIQYILSLWDTAGQESYDRLRPLSYPKTDCFVLCYACNSKSSLANAELKWMPELRHYNPKTAIILVGTKVDMRDNCADPVTDKEGKRMKNKIKAHAFVECSAKTRQGLDEIFEEAVRATMRKRNGFCGLL